MTPADLTAFIKQEALNLGFDACGVAAATPVSPSEAARFNAWLAEGRQGEMRYLERNLSKRLDPVALVPGARSVIVVALNYATEGQRPASGIARYACRPDYHPIIRQRLRTLMERLEATGQPVRGRAFSDSAPLLERYWSHQAGLGWIGKNRLLIRPEAGSWFLLGLLVTDLELCADSPQPDRCGHCRRCLDACPGNALDETTGLDPRRCIAYLTIEKQSPLSDEERLICAAGQWLFGCDTCQEVCPWNRFSQPANDPAFPRLTKLEQLNLEALGEMTPATFASLAAGTALERTGLAALLRTKNALQQGSDVVHKKNPAIKR